MAMTQSKRRFAGRPMWLHFEKPLLGLGRLVWLRWIDIPAKPEVNAQCRLDRERRGLLIWAIIDIVLVLLLFCLVVSGAKARDLGQWQASDPAVRQWYRSLMQPDNPSVPCCGEADGYWADEIHVRDGKTFATVTDDRADEPLHRPHVPVGTEIEIPDAKLKWDRGNPSGHGVVFLSSNRHVYCYVQGSGI
jgi:hypothetical protein